MPIISLFMIMNASFCWRALENQTGTGFVVPRLVELRLFKLYRIDGAAGRAISSGLSVEAIAALRPMTAPGLFC